MRSFFAFFPRKLLLAELALCMFLLVAGCGGAGMPAASATGVELGNAGQAKVTSTPSVEGTPVPSADAEAAVPIDADDPHWGNPNAPVTIVLFSDFQCPFCSRLEPTFDQIRIAYGPDNVRVVWKNEPLSFHPWARPAAILGVGIRALYGDAMFFDWKSRVFAQQSAITQAYSTDGISAATDKLLDSAVAAGADRGKLTVDQPSWAAKVDRDHATAGNVGVDGTPASFINGVELGGAVPFDQFKTVIDAQLVAAKVATSRGVSGSMLYPTLTKENFKPRKPPQDDDDADDGPAANVVYKVAVGNAPFIGPATAPVTIVEFSDFQCPFCKKVEPALNEIRKTYGDKVRIVWKNEPLPFHPRALPAANLALFVRSKLGDTGFWRAHDLIFASQPKLEDSDLADIAVTLGLNRVAALDAMLKNAYRTQIEAETNEADDVQANGTPHFFINGKRLVGAVPLEKLKKVIDAELAHANQVLATGIAPDALYTELIKNGQGATPFPTKKPPSLPAKAYVRGDPNAKVMIQIFSDYQCPFCSRVEPTITKLMDDYKGKVKFVWRDKPLAMHPNAVLAAEAAREAGAQRGNAGYWEMHDKLFANQQNLTRADLDKYAAEMHLDPTRFARALDTHAHKAAVDADAKAGDDAQVSGTPSFFVGEYFISGAQPYSKFRKAVELALHGEARAAAAKP